MGRQNILGNHDTFLSNYRYIDTTFEATGARAAFTVIHDSSSMWFTFTTFENIE